MLLVFNVIFVDPQGLPNHVFVILKVLVKMGVLSGLMGVGLEEVPDWACKLDMRRSQALVLEVHAPMDPVKTVVARTAASASEINGRGSSFLTLCGLGKKSDNVVHLSHGNNGGGK